MSLKYEVHVTNHKALEAMWQVYAMARVQQALKEGGRGTTAPGFALAVAIVDAEFANARAEMSGEVLREASRAGHDIGRSLAVGTVFVKGKPVVEIEMPDLSDVEP